LFGFQFRNNDPKSAPATTTAHRSTARNRELTTGELKTKKPEQSSARRPPTSPAREIEN